LEVPALAKGIVEGKDLLEHERDRPGVQHDVMIGPDECIPVLGSTHEGETRERCAGQIETTCPVCFEKGVQERLLPGRPDPSPVQLLNREHGLSRHDLDRLFQSLADDCGAQHRVPVCHSLPGTPERHDVQGAMEGASHLLDVHPGSGSVQAMKQHTLLRR
jgi:hypothetical protein